jgi:hypothetical protein
MPPVTLAPGALIGAVTVTNSGDADAYPVWTVTGPGAAPTLANTTTGKSFGMAVPLAAGETVTIDTRPTMQSAVDSAGRNRWPDLVKAGPRQLWPLVPGENVVDLRMAGVAPGSRIVLSFVRRWLRA